MFRFKSTSDGITIILDTIKLEKTPYFLSNRIIIVNNYLLTYQQSIAILKVMKVRKDIWNWNKVNYLNSI